MEACFLLCLYPRPDMRHEHSKTVDPPLGSVPGRLPSSHNSPEGWADAGEGSQHRITTGAQLGHERLPSAA